MIIENFKLVCLFINMLYYFGRLNQAYLASAVALMGGKAGFPFVVVSLKKNCM